MKSTDITRPGFYWHRYQSETEWSVAEVRQWTFPHGDAKFYSGDYDDLRTMEGDFVGPIEPPSTAETERCMDAVIAQWNVMTNAFVSSATGQPLDCVADRSIGGAYGKVSIREKPAT